MFQKQQHKNGRMKDLWTTLHKGPLDHDQKSIVWLSIFMIFQKGSIIIYSLRFLLCLMRFAEVEQIQNTFINMITFKKC